MLLPPVLLPLRSPTPSASEIIGRSQRAYDAVRTLEQDVVGGIGGSKGTAHIAFVRPGRLRVSGSTIFGSKYDLLADGRSTWVFNRGSWSPAQSPEMGIATITGISGNAGTLTPAMLLHTAWGRLSPATATSYTAALETVKGRKLWRLHGTTPFVSITWIDPSTYFVVRTESVVMKSTIDVVFSPPKVNGAIPASRFKR